MFVYYTYTDDGSLVMINTYKGTDSIFKVSDNKKEKVLNWLNGQLSGLDEDFYKLKEYGYFIDDDVDEKLLRELSYNESRMDSNLHLVIHVTERCNFRCTYCGLDFENCEDLSDDMQDAIIKYIARNIKKYNSVILDWFGGEPTLRIDIIEKISKKPLFSTITTNGYLLTTTNVQRLLQCGVYKYVITLDGLKENHNKMRVLEGGKGTYDVILNNLKNMSKNVQRHFEVWIRTNMTIKNSTEEYLTEYYDYYNEIFGKDARFSLFARPTNDLGGERVEEIRDALLGNNNQTMSEIIKTLSENSKDMIYKGNMRDLNVGGCRCPASRLNKYNILVDGTINKCDDGEHSRYSIGKLLKDGTMDIKDSIHARWLFNNATDRNEKCDDCAFSMICNMDGCPKYRIATGRTHCPLKREEFESSLLLWAVQDDTKIL